MFEIDDLRLPESCRRHLLTIGLGSMFSPHVGRAVDWVRRVPGLDPERDKETVERLLAFYADRFIRTYLYADNVQGIQDENDGKLVGPRLQKILWEGWRDRNDIVLKDLTQEEAPEEEPGAPPMQSDHDDGLDELLRAYGGAA